MPRGAFLGYRTGIGRRAATGSSSTALVALALLGQRHGPVRGGLEAVREEVPEGLSPWGAPGSRRKRRAPRPPRPRLRRVPQSGRLKRPSGTIGIINPVP